MDDEFAGIGLAIVAICVVIGLACFVIGLALFTAPFWGLGVAGGMAVNGAGRLVLSKDLQSPSILSRLVNLQFDGSMLRGNIVPAAVRQYAQFPNVLMVTVCLLLPVFLFLLLAYTPDTTFFNSIQNFLATLGIPFRDLMPIFFLAIVALSIGSAIFLWEDFNLVSAVESHVNHSLSQANTSFDTADRLDDFVQKNERLAQGLGISFPQDYFDSIRAFVNTNKAGILADPSLLENAISRETEHAEEDNNNLAKATTRIEAVENQWEQVSHAVYATGSPSMLNTLDQLYEQLLQQKQTFLPNRDWDIFGMGMSIIEEEFSKLEQQARNFSQGTSSSPDPTGAYAVLGVSPDMDNEQIRQKRNELAKRYHPDGRNNRDELKMKEINLAYAEIMSEPGRKKHG